MWWFARDTNWKLFVTFLESFVQDGEKIKGRNLKQRRIYFVIFNKGNQKFHQSFTKLCHRFCWFVSDAFPDDLISDATRAPQSMTLLRLICKYCKSVNNVTKVVQWEILRLLNLLFTLVGQIFTIDPLEIRDETPTYVCYVPYRISLISLSLE